MFLSNSVDMMKNLNQTFHRTWFTFLIYHKSYLQLHSIVDYGDLKGVTKEKVQNVWQLFRIELFVLLLHRTTKYSYLFLIETSIENVSKTFKSMYLKEWVNAVERLSNCSPKTGMGYYNDGSKTFRNKFRFWNPYMYFPWSNGKTQTTTVGSFFGLGFDFLSK